MLMNINSGLSTQCFCVFDHACVTHSPLSQAWITTPPFLVPSSGNDTFDFTESLPLAPHLTESLPMDFVDDEMIGFDNSSVTLGPSPPANTLSAVTSNSVIPSLAVPARTHNSTRNSTRTVACRFTGCLLLFRRDHERTRHENSVHMHVPGLYVCGVFGCRNNTDGGYKRADKLTEHMWKAHADMGFVKRG